MNQEIKKKWVDALRSGEFAQTQGRLKASNGYCCLGVLCELYRQENGGEWDGGAFMGHFGGTLPVSVCEWAYTGNQQDPIVYVSAVPYSLSYLNDSRYTFREIADLIETQL